MAVVFIYVHKTLLFTCVAGSDILQCLLNKVLSGALCLSITASVYICTAGHLVVFFVSFPVCVEPSSERAWQHVQINT